MRKFFFFMCLLWIFPSFAVDHVGRIVKLEGSSKIYIPQAKITLKSEKHIRFRDQLYRVVEAQRGMKLENGYVVNTSPNAKLKVIFNNGDHFYVAPNTQYVIEWVRPTLKEKEKTVMNVIRGAVRSVVEKDGPRSGMEVKTRSTTFGVRGTEFWVNVLNSHSTEVSVLRGVIEFKEKDKESVVIEKGEKAFVSLDQIRKESITKQDLTQIAQESLPTQVEKVEEESLKALEKKALQVTVNDIKLYEPELYKSISDKHGDLQGSEELTKLTLDSLKEKAPEAKPEAKVKPSLKDLETKEDPYKKYYKEE
jgi:hypothetical protein